MTDLRAEVKWHAVAHAYIGVTIQARGQAALLNFGTCQLSFQEAAAPLYFCIAKEEAVRND